MSILDQVRRARVAHVDRPAPIEPTTTPSEAPLDEPAADPANSGPPAFVESPARHQSYGVQPASFAVDAQSLEWTSAVNRTLRLQAERRQAHEELKSRIHENLIE